MDKSQACNHRTGQLGPRFAFSAVTESGEVHLPLTYQQGGEIVIWATADKPSLPLYADSDTVGLLMKVLVI
jgi:hypothetical protein